MATCESTKAMVVVLPHDGTSGVNLPNSSGYLFVAERLGNILPFRLVRMRTVAVARSKGQILTIVHMSGKMWLIV